MPVVKTFDLTKRYGTTTAVDKLNLEVEEGEILGLLGPNGAGKSSTLLMLTTVIKPTEGTAVVGGYDIREHPYAVRNIVGIAFQEPKLYWVNSPLEILSWHAKVCKTPDRKVVVEDILKRLDIWDVRKKLANELSGGMKKRVEVAKVLIQKPKIAIVDEPTAQIDISGKYKIWDMIEALKEEGSTIILATNELYEADRLSDRVAILHKGSLLVCDSPRKLKDTIPGGDVVDLRLENGITEQTLSQLKEVPNVVKVATLKPTHIRIYLNRAERIVPKIMSILFESAVPISSINMKEPSLDDVFFHYTGLALEEANA